ncbi:TPA: hypothetical protein ACG6YL_000134, partial [Escherichia coli]
PGMLIFICLSLNINIPHPRKIKSRLISLKQQRVTEIMSVYFYSGKRNLSWSLESNPDSALFSGSAESSFFRQ